MNKIEQKLRTEVLNEIQKTSPMNKVKEKYNQYAKYCFQVKDYDEEKFEEIQNLVGDYMLEIQRNSGYRNNAYKEVKNHEAFKNE